MTSVVEWIARLVTAWKCWVIVSPWEIGIRVRLGKRAVALLPGPHWRIPFLDEMLIVNTRLRVTSIPTVTIDSDKSDDKVRCRKATIGFRIVDPLLAVQAYEHPAVAVAGRTQAIVARGLSGAEIHERLEQEFSSTGIIIEFVEFCEDVEAPALRLLQADWTIASEHASSVKGLY